ncbi:MAG TPA: hypothetical protein DD856_13760 [Sulfobacillus sp.]|nr:hypothetical protein [Sulfobacillus sp.]
MTGLPVATSDPALRYHGLQNQMTEVDEGVLILRVQDQISEQVSSCLYGVRVIRNLTMTRDHMTGIVDRAHRWI